MLAISLTGEGGYHVLTPLQLNDGRLLLVDRGWIPYDRRDHFATVEGQTKIAGILRQPESHLFVPKNDVAKNNWYQIDLTAMAQNAGIGPFMPFVMDVDATPNEGGYPVGGQTRIDLPNNHFGYAVTWFGLAAVLVIIYLVYSFPTRENKRVAED
jgi:surfeit locus 1 family protein